MIIGKVYSINQNKRIFSVKIEEQSFSIIEFYGLVDISVGDRVLAEPIRGDVFVKNETKKTYFQAHIHYLDVLENKMLKLLDL